MTHFKAKFWASDRMRKKLKIEEILGHIMHKRGLIMRNYTRFYVFEDGKQLLYH